MVNEEMRRRACKSHEGEGERKRSETTAELDGAHSLGAGVVERRKRGK